MLGISVLLRSMFSSAIITIAYQYIQVASNTEQDTNPILCTEGIILLNTQISFLAVSLLMLVFWLFIYL